MGDNSQALLYHKKLQKLMDDLAHLTYDVTERFPENEQFGLTSQIRRSSIPVVLNYIEGFARQKPLVYKNFLEISCGSLKENQYLIRFCRQRKFLSYEERKKLSNLSEEIGRMLWGILKNVKKE